MGPLEKENTMFFSKRWFHACLAFAWILAAGACASSPETKATPASTPGATPASAPAKTGPAPLVISTFRWVEERYSEGHSGHVSSKALVFSLRGKEMALVHRTGIKGRSVVKGEPGTKIADGQPMNLPVGKARRDPDPKVCTLTFGESCEVEFGGKCLSTCKAELSVNVLDAKRLAQCFKAGADPVVAQLLKEGVVLHSLKLKSPCVFLHGEGLKLQEEE